MAHFLALQVGLIALATPLAAQVRIAVGDVDGDGRFVSVHAEAAPDAGVRLETRPQLSAGAWVPFDELVVATSSGRVDFNLPAGFAAPETSFFRVSVTSYGIQIRDDGRNYLLDIGAPAPLPVVLTAVRRQTGEEVFLQPGTATEPESIPAGHWSAPTLERLFAQLGLTVIAAPSGEETATRLARRTPNLGPVPDPLEPPTGSIGQGVNEDGAKGDSTKPERVDPTNPTPPRDGTMTVSAEGQALRDGAAPDDERTDPPSGHHLRLQVELGAGGRVNLVKALDLPGDAARPPVAGGLGAGSVVVVFRSPLARTAPGNIYGLHTVPDPFLQHSFFAPDDRSEHVLPGEIAALRIPLAVLPGDDDLEGLTVEFYKVMAEMDSRPLDATAFLRQVGQLQMLGMIPGAEVVAKTLRPMARAHAGPAGPGKHGPPDPTLTALMENGPKSKKYNLVFMGDGFANTEADQKKFNDYVQAAALNGTFSRGIYRETFSAFNLYRINTYSEDSGITRVNSSGIPITNLKRNTALGMQYSGLWERCWIELSYAAPISSYRINNILDDLLPEWDRVVIVINVDDKGGCSSSLGYVYIPLGSPFAPFASNSTTLDHELGHAVGSLGDEYYCKPKDGEPSCPNYSDSEPGKANLTKQTQRNSIKWREWIPPWRPIPTLQTNVASQFQDVGLFAGATTDLTKFKGGIYRPTWNGVMNGDTGGFNPIGVAAMRSRLAQHQDRTLAASVSGDFNGDGQLDLVSLDGRELALYLSAPRNLTGVDPILGTLPRTNGMVLQPTWFNTGPLKNSQGLTWVSSSSDELIPGDFDGDGKTDLFVVNTHAWNKFYCAMLRSTGTNFTPVKIYTSDLPGWQLSPTDYFYVGDFNGDKKADLFVYNGLNWNHPYASTIYSTGTSLTSGFLHILYLGTTYTMGRHERFLVGDLNGDGRDDVVAQNREDWSEPAIGVFLSTENKSLICVPQYGYSGAIKPSAGGRWNLRTGDLLTLADVDGDKSKELILFNGNDWSKRYLAMFRFVPGGLGFLKVHTDTVGSWKMGPNDRFYSGHFNFDDKEDLLVMNTTDFKNDYLVLLNSTGGGNLESAWQKSPIGFFDFGEGAKLHIGDFSGGFHLDDLIAIRGNDVWMVRGSGLDFSAETYYPGWITNQRWHQKGYW